MKKRKPALTALETLAPRRDDLKLQRHLFPADAKEQWEHIEKDLQILESEAKRLAIESKKTFVEAAKDIAPLIQKIEASLLRVQEGVRRHHLSQAL